MEQALSSPTHPPAESALTLLAFLRDELPLGGTAAEARFLRLFPLLVSRIVGDVNTADGYRHIPDGWLGRRERWSINGRGVGGGTGSSGGGHLRGSSIASGGSSASSGGSSGRRDSTYGTGAPTYSSHGVRRPGTPGGSAAPSIEDDPVVVLLRGDRSGPSSSSNGPGSSSANGGGGRLSRQPTLIDAVSDESVHRPGVRFSFDFRALPRSTQEALAGMLLDPQYGTAPGSMPSPSAQLRPNAARLLGSVLRVPAAEQADLRRQLQMYQQQRRMNVGGGAGGFGGAVRTAGGLSPLGSAAGHHGPVVAGAAANPAMMGPSSILPLPTDVRAAVSLSMLEYYLINVVRFAAFGQSAPSAPTSTFSSGASQTATTATATATISTTSSSANTASPGRSSSSSGSSSNTGVNRYPYSSSRTNYGEQVYLHLFRSYARRYLPHSAPMMPPPLNPTQGRNRRLPRPPDRTFAELDRDGEFFLRLVLELWLDGDNSGAAAPTAAEAVRCLSNRGGGGIGSIGSTLLGGPMTPSTPLPSGTSAFDVGLEMSSELADVAWGSSVQYAAPPLLVRKGTRSLVNHIVADPAIGNAVGGEAAFVRQRRGVGGVLQIGASVVASRSTPASASRSTESATSESSVGGWCLTPAMTALQTPFFNYVRMNLRHGPVHVSDSPFFWAMNAWLVWLEPWNCSVRRNRPVGGNLSSPTNAKKFLADTVQSLGGQSSKFDTYTSSVTIPKATAPSTYTGAWEPYIAANLHLYVVPLAIFLRRARELDFSPNEFHRSLAHVQRIFRVFTPEVVRTINKLLSRQQGHGVLSELVAQHEQNLGVFCPPRGREGLSLSSCWQDMHNVLEEMYLQHRKKLREQDFLDRFAENVESFFGQGSKGDEVALEKVLAQARVIVSLPDDYEVIPGEKKKGSRGPAGALLPSAQDPGKPERVHGRLLTETGRNQIITGTRKCNAMDVAYLGDPMYSRVKSYEIPVLVDWTLWLSDWINDRLRIVPSQEKADEDQTHSGISDSAALVLKLCKQSEDRESLPFRVNLRFLADYRNLICLAVLNMLYKAIF